MEDIAAKVKNLKYDFEQEILGYKSKTRVG